MDRDIWIVIISVLLIVIVIITVVVVVGYFLERYRCKKIAEGMSVESDYGLWKGCFIRTREGWKPLSKYRYAEVE